MTANTPNSPQSTPPAGSEMAVRVRNFLIAIVAIILSTAIFLGLNTETGPSMLSSLAEAATPLDVALSNGKPSLMEFYANWCTSCQTMAKDMDELKQEYGDRVNFVMLNVDNDKWLPEMLKFRVDGIPHFVFMKPGGEAIASTIGEQPRPIMAANLEALATNDPLPYIPARGLVSKVDAPVAPKASADSDPRSHGSQVVQ